MENRNISSAMLQTSNSSSVSSCSTNAESESRECGVKIDVNTPFIPDVDRFTCSIPECSFKGISCDILINHMLSVHKDVKNFSCHHCTKPTVVPLKDLREHLYFHSGFLIRCVYCVFYHHSLIEVVKHCESSHPSCDMKCKILRLIGKEPSELIYCEGNVRPEFYDTDTEILNCDLIDDVVEVISDNGSEVEILDADGKSKINNERQNNDCEVEVVYVKRKENIGCNDKPEEKETRDLYILEKESENYENLSNPQNLTGIGNVSDGEELEAVENCIVNPHNLTDISEVPENTVICTSKGCNQGESNVWSSDQRIYVPDRIDNLIRKFGMTVCPAGDMFSCPKCNKFKTSSEAEIVDHIYKEINYCRFVCTHCKEMARSEARIREHYLRTHAKKGKFESFACLPPDPEVEQWVEYVISKQLEAMNKDKHSHPSEDILEDSETFQCDTCKEKFFSEAGLNAHLKSFHFPLESWICGHCNFISKCRMDMLKHIEGNHPDFQQSCFKHCMPATAITLNIHFWINYFETKNSEVDSSASATVSSDNRNDKSETREENDVNKLSCLPCVSRARLNIFEDSTTPPREIKEKDKCSPKPNSKHVAVVEEDKCVDATGISDKIEKETVEEKSSLDHKFIFTCFYCPALSWSSASAEKHWEIAHRNVQSDDELPVTFEKWKENDFLFKLHAAGMILCYYCSYCMASGSDLFVMMKHICEYHGGSQIKIIIVRQKVYVCVVCGMLLSSLSNIMDHFKENHSAKTILFEVHSDMVNSFKLSKATKVCFLNNLDKKFGSCDHKVPVDNISAQKSYFFCFWCKEDFDTRFSLIIHHIGYHSHLAPVFKKEKNPSNTTRNFYRKLCFMPSKIPFMIIDKNAYLCPFCFRKTFLFEDLFYHLFQHALPFKCCMCGFSAGSGNEVYLHFKVAHPEDVPAIAHVRMLEDVMGRLLHMVDGVESVDKLQEGSSLESRNEKPSDNMGSSLNQECETKNLNKSCSHSFCNFGSRTKVGDSTDFSHINVWYKFNGVGRLMKFSELSKIVNINPSVCVSKTVGIEYYKTP